MSRPGCKCLVGVGCGVMVLWVCFALDVHAEPVEGPKTGVFTAEFSDRSPLSGIDALAKRMHLRPGTKPPAYDLADHTFQLVVPDAYDAEEAYGLLVFIHPNNNVSIERVYANALNPILAEHKLIWVSFSGAGNPVLPHIRLGLALDAVHNVTKRYRIDDDRVYVSGLSGGGRMTCMAGVYYPELFTGAIPIVGSLYFRDAKLPNDPALLALIQPEENRTKAVWPRALIEPKASVLRRMKVQQRWVLLAGEKDYNMPEMRAHFEQGFSADKFEHAHYLEVPGMGHRYPPTEWFEKAVKLLDKPIERADPLEAGPPDERTQRIAQRQLEHALRVRKRDAERAAVLLERLIKEHPNTDAAEQAEAVLLELKQEPLPAE